MERHFLPRFFLIFYQILFCKFALFLKKDPLSILGFFIKKNAFRH